MLFILSLSLGTLRITKANPILQHLPVITIKNDGRIDSSLYPSPISKTGNVFTLKENITGYSIAIQCSNITFDGAGCALDGQGKLTDNSGIYLEASFVIISNTIISGYGWAGINITSLGNTIIDNNITGSLNYALYIEGRYNNITGNTLFSDNCDVWLANSASNNTLVGNNLTSTTIIGNYNTFYRNEFHNNLENAVNIYGGHNSFYSNNFMNNLGRNVWVWQDSPNAPAQQNTFDNGSLGNYWSNYNGMDADYNGIGDTPYIIAGNTTDRYPLMLPCDISNNTLTLPVTSPSYSISSSPSPTQIPTLSPSPSESAGASVLRSASEQPTLSPEPEPTFPVEYLYAAGVIVVVVIILVMALILRRKK